MVLKVSKNLFAEMRGLVESLDKLFGLNLLDKKSRDVAKRNFSLIRSEYEKIKTGNNNKQIKNLAPRVSRFSEKLKANQPYKLIWQIINSIFSFFNVFSCFFGYKTVKIAPKVILKQSEKPSIIVQIKTSLSLFNSQLTSLKRDYEEIEKAFLSTKKPKLAELNSVISFFLEKLEKSKNDSKKLGEQISRVKKGHLKKTQIIEIEDLYNNFTQKNAIFKSYLDSMKLAIKLEEERDVLLKKITSFPSIGLPNLGVTCFVNTFLKTFFQKNGPYVNAILSKSLVKKRDEKGLHFFRRQELLFSLKNLIQDIHNLNLSHEEITKSLLKFVNNPLLYPEIKKIKLGRLEYYKMGDALALAQKVFDLLEIDQLPQVTIIKSNIRKSNNPQNLPKVTALEKFISIHLNEGSTITQKIKNYLTPSIIEGDISWGDPLNSETRDFFVYSEAFENVVFDITSGSLEEVGGQLLTEVEEEILVPVCNDEGILVGNMVLSLESVGCNVPDFHYVAFVKEEDGSWTEHNDNLLIKNLSLNSLLNRKGINISRHGCYFVYRKKAFILI